MTRDELIKEINKIWDTENMLKEFCEPLPEFCKTYLQAVQEQADFILSREKALRDENELLNLSISILNKRLMTAMHLLSRWKEYKIESYLSESTDEFLKG